MRHPAQLLNVNHFRQRCMKARPETPISPNYSNRQIGFVLFAEVVRPRGRNIKGRPFGVDFDRRSLRSDCRQGSKPAARRSARASLCVLDCLLAPASALPWRSRRSPILGCARFDEISMVLEVMPPQKNHSASPVARNFWAMIEGRPFVVTFERFLNSLRKERP